MTKSSKRILTQKQQIRENKAEIDRLTQEADCAVNVSESNYVREKITYKEPRTLFYSKQSSSLKAKMSAHFDFTCNKNLGDAYDYIICNPNTNIDTYAICKIHATLCSGTYLSYVGGQYRDSVKLLEITVNGERYHAPEAYEVPSKMNQIIFDLQNSKTDPLTKAFDIHYKLIALQPFEDFNKRTARLIMNWVLTQNGFRPIVFDAPSDKTDYKKAIAACLNGDKKAYNTYMASCMIRTQKQIIKLLKNIVRQKAQRR